MIRIAENISELRKRRGITQEELADYLGVTKASVSKWENGQSMPDIMLLPQIATYFEVTVDGLLGYEPQLSKEQIQEKYRELALAFSKEPFETVFARSEAYVKEYYTCYRFLVQIGVLWINHFNLAETVERQKEILEKIELLCNRIIENCKNANICSEAIAIRAIVCLQTGRPERTIEELEEMDSPYKLMRHSNGLLIQAYAMKGDMEKADEYTQGCMFAHLFCFINETVQYLGLHIQETDFCMDTIRRIDALIPLYGLDKIMQNTIALYQYHVAMVMCMTGDTAEAIKRLWKHVKLIVDLLESASPIRGDSYFNKVEKCFAEFELGGQMVRDRKVIMESMIESFENPVFSILEEKEEYQKIKMYLENAKKRI